MAITLPDDLSEQLQQLAQEQNTTPEALLRQLLERQSDYYSLDNVKRRLYDRARRYWQTQRDTECAVLTDAELDKQFWGFDRDDIPRLKSDPQVADAIANPLLQMAENAIGAEQPHSTAARFDDALRESWADHLNQKLDHNAD